MKTDLQKAVIGWDVKNWSRALRFWSDHLPDYTHPLKCLELGGKEGGLSLWLAKQGHEVICSDLQNPGEAAQPIHEKFKVAELISYAAIDATAIPYHDHFDLIAFKSILGGISRMGRDEKKTHTMQQIHQALKPGGILLFAENLKASVVHQFFRRNFVKWGKNWNYLQLGEIAELLDVYEHWEVQTFGYWGAFGRSESQRTLLASIDSLLNPLTPPSSRYIIFGIAKKEP